MNKKTSEDTHRIHQIDKMQVCLDQIILAVFLCTFVSVTALSLPWSKENPCIRLHTD